MDDDSHTFCQLFYIDFLPSSFSLLPLVLSFFIINHLTPCLFLFLSRFLILQIHTAIFFPLWPRPSPPLHCSFLLFHPCCPVYLLFCNQVSQQEQIQGQQFLSWIICISECAKCITELKSSLAVTLRSRWRCTDVEVSDSWAGLGMNGGSMTHINRQL